MAWLQPKPKSNFQIPDPRMKDFGFYIYIRYVPLTTEKRKKKKKKPKAKHTIRNHSFYYVPQAGEGVEGSNIRAACRTQKRA
jgi:hypothetical protein